MIAKTVIACIVWVALVLGVDYLVTKMENDAIDEKFGMVAGAGFVAIIVGSIVIAKTKRDKG